MRSTETESHPDIQIVPVPNCRGSSPLRPNFPVRRTRNVSRSGQKERTLHCACLQNRRAERESNSFFRLRHIDKIYSFVAGVGRRLIDTAKEDHTRGPRICWRPQPSDLAPPPSACITRCGGALVAATLTVTYQSPAAVFHTSDSAPSPAPTPQRLRTSRTVPPFHLASGLSASSI